MGGLGTSGRGERATEQEPAGDSSDGSRTDRKEGYRNRRRGQQHTARRKELGLTSSCFDDQNHATLSGSVAGEGQRMALDSRDRLQEWCYGGSRMEDVAVVRQVVRWMDLRRGSLRPTESGKQKQSDPPDSTLQHHAVSGAARCDIDITAEAGREVESRGVASVARPR
jgi:hypothetical protein